MPSPIRPLTRSDLPQMRALERLAAERLAECEVTVPSLRGLDAERISAIHDGLAFGIDDGEDLVGLVYATVLAESATVGALAVRSTPSSPREEPALLERLDQAAKALGLGSTTLTTFARVPSLAPYFATLGFGPSAGSLGATLLSVEAANGFVEDERVAMRRPIPSDGDEETLVLEALDESTKAAIHDLLGDSSWAPPEDTTHAVVRREGEVVAHAALVPRTVYIGASRWSAGSLEAMAARDSTSDPDHRVVRSLTARLRNRFDLLTIRRAPGEFETRPGWHVWEGQTFVVRDGTVEAAPRDDGTVLVQEALLPLPDLSTPLGRDA